MKEGPCFHLTGEDRVGALSDTLDRVAQEGINLHAVDAIALDGKYVAYVWTEEKDVERLAKVLKANPLKAD
jgi:ACT domain-containing protein